MIQFKDLEDASHAVDVVGPHLAGGGLIAYPTETVYGLGGRARAEDVDHVARLKGRTDGSPFLLLAANRSMVQKMELELSGYADRLGDAFWPGPLTLVLRGGQGTLPDSLRGPEGGIAVRVTSQPALAHLIKSLDYPVTSTSANPAGKPPAADASAIADAFGDAVDEGDLLILDGGGLANQAPSTVVDCTGVRPRLIREGAVAGRDVIEFAEGSTG